jgi:hypothetical protein
MIHRNLQEWQARLLGFVMPLWCVLVVSTSGPLQHPREIAGLIGLAIGAMAALWTLASGDEGRSRSIAQWFLLGLAAMFAAGVLTTLIVGID